MISLAVLPSPPFVYFLFRALKYEVRRFHISKWTTSPKLLLWMLCWLKQHLIWIQKSNVLAVKSGTNSTGLVSTKSVNKIFGSLLNAIEHDNCSGTS